jgi:hypothetical protein
MAAGVPVVITGAPLPGIGDEAYGGDRWAVGRRGRRGGQPPTAEDVEPVT